MNSNVALSNNEFCFTNDWFESSAKGVWDVLIPQIKPTKILEIGSFEGASACYLIGRCASERLIEIHCVDTWEGGVEHKDRDLDIISVEQRFFHNTQVACKNASHPVELMIHKGFSHLGLSKLLNENRSNYFDFIYIDGSHQAPDVLSDAILSFHLLKVGGVMVFDDYLWAEDMSYGRDPLRCPKPAIDAFLNIYFRKMEIMSAPLYQIYARKLSN